MIIKLWHNLIVWGTDKKLQEVHTIVKDFLKRVKINGWKWHTQIGAGDAASTGIVTGYAWGQKEWLLEL